MKTYAITIGLLLMAVTLFCQTPSTVSRRVLEAKAAKAKFQTVQLFDNVGEAKYNKNLKNALKGGQMLNLKTKELKLLYASKPNSLTLELPSAQKSAMRLELVRHDLLTSDFSVRDNKSKGKLKYQPGVFYHGIVQGSNNSVAAISIFENEVIGVVSDAAEGQMTLGKAGESAKSTNYVFYRQQELIQAPGFSCEAINTPGSKPSEPTKDGNSKVLAKCVRAYLECDYDLVNEKGGATGAVNYITGLMNMVSTLYLNDAITLNVSEIFTWTTPDTYPTNSSSSVLTAFKAARPTYNGNIAHLISRGAPTNAGIAYVDALCTAYAYGYSSIASTYATVPTYSWSVGVLAHEMGHNLGSPHTHACVWNGNNTAIDGCGPQIGSNEGCTGPIPVKGTIMSYCHMVNGVGIDFNLGFGPQPGDRIRGEVNAATCLTTCGSSGGCSLTVTLSGGTSICSAGTGIVTATSTGTAPFTYSWSNGGTTQTISGLSAGTYNVTITDAAGCIGTGSRTITLSGLTLTTTVTNETSAGAKNGAINLTVAGGTAPQTYIWSNGPTTEDLAGLAAGTYTVTVTSANGCTGIKSATVTTSSSGGGGSCLPLVALPHSQSFEGNIGTWTQDTNDGMDWTVKSGTTPTINSGPSAASLGSYYLYTEATGNTGKLSRITSPCFNLASVVNPVIRFNYHMYGAQMGSLKLEISTNAGSTWTSIWSLSGNQTNVWRTATISLSSYATQTAKFRFVATIGGDTSDKAIDGINIRSNSN